MSLAIEKGSTHRTCTVALLLIFFVLAGVSQKATAESRIALVIGNGAYESSPLNDPPNDAQLIANTLRKLGFEVTERTNLGRKQMRRLIREFGHQLKSQKHAVGLFYYSGHGMQVGGRNYMIPIGSDIHTEVDVSDDGVGMDYVLSYMNTAKNAMNLIILDACRNNPYEKRFKSAINGLNIMDAPKGSLIAFAAEPHKTALQGDGKYSIFSAALAREMVRPGITVTDMLTNVRIAVDRETRSKQLPVTENRLLGSFYFKPGQQVSMSQPKESVSPPTVANKPAGPESIGRIDSINTDFNMVFIKLTKKIPSDGNLFVLLPQGSKVRMRINKAADFYATAIADTGLHKLTPGDWVYVDEP